jgi:hypothetical protein
VAAALVGLGAGPYRLRWFDPRTGRFLVVADQVQPSVGVLPLPDKPDDADWLLLAQALERDTAVARRVDR